MATGNQQRDNLPPPVPARPNDQQYFMTPRFGPYAGGSPYGVMPSFLGMNSNIYGAHQQIDSTFQSIQSIVQAFSSISMMLESTYMAVHSSFRAVMDVAEHVTLLKQRLSGILSITAMFETVKWFYRRILYMFNMVNEDQIWSDSLASASQAIETGQRSILEHGKSQSSWPILMFLGVAIGAPYMIYQFQKPAGTSSKWLTQEDSHYIAEALYDFEAKQDNEISFKSGQKVIIAPKEQQPRVSDWLLATIDGKKAGLIPMNYVKIVKFEIVE